MAHPVLKDEGRPSKAYALHRVRHEGDLYGCAYGWDDILDRPFDFDSVKK